MGDYIAMLESQYARLAAKQTALDDTTKVAVMRTTLQEIPDYSPFITSISVMTEKDTTWIQVSALFVEEAKRLNSRRETTISQTTDYTERLAQTLYKFNSNNNKKRNNFPRQMTCYYCSAKRHRAKACHIHKHNQEKSFCERNGIVSDTSKQFNMQIRAT